MVSVSSVVAKLFDPINLKTHKKNYKAEEKKREFFLLNEGKKGSEKFAISKRPETLTISISRLLFNFG